MAQHHCPFYRRNLDSLPPATDAVRQYRAFRLANRQRLHPQAIPPDQGEHSMKRSSWYPNILITTWDLLLVGRKGSPRLVMSRKGRPVRVEQLVEDEICRCLYELLSNVQLEGFRIKLGNRWIGRRIH